MNYLLRFLIGFLLFNLSACTLSHSIAKPHSAINQSHVLCVQRFDLCQKSCVDNKVLCAKKANHSAKVSYKRYMQQEKVIGGYKTRGLKSYRDPLQCRKVTCDCYADLMDCKQISIEITKNY